MKRLWAALFFQFAPQVMSFLIFTVIVRRYDVLEIAAYVYALNLFYLIMPGLNPAFDQIVQVRLKDKSQTAGAVLSSTALVVLAISVLFSIAAVVYLHLSASDLESSRTFWGFIPALIVTPFTVTVQLFRAMDDYSSQIRISIVNMLVGATARTILALMQADIALIALSFCIDPLVSCVYSAQRSLLRTGTISFSRPRASLLSELVRLAPLLVSHAFLAVMFVRAPTLMLAQTSSPGDFVKYGIALQFLAAMLSAGNSLFYVIGPSLAHLEIGSTDFMRLSRALFLLCSIVSVLFFVSNLVFAEFIAVHVFGPKAVGVGSIAAILSPIASMQTLMNFRNTLALRTRAFSRQLLALFLSFALLAAMMWLTVPPYAGVGAALSLSLVHVMCAYPMSLLVPAMRPLLPELLKCGLGLGGWRDLLDFVRRNTRG
jgi:O-antigen/teichoic acid export membrane protein